MCAPESSRQASKRKRKESLSSRFASSDAPITETHLTNEDLNDVTSENPYQSCNEENLTKKKRGPTVCHDVANEDGKKIVLELNNLGQPIGKSYVLYSSFYGSLVKEAVSINYDDWRYVPKQQKALLLRALEQKFVLEGDAIKKCTLQMMGKVWRAHKSRLTKKLDARPSHVKPAEWETFIKKKTSKAFMDKSKVFTEMRAKQDIPYTGSRMGYARMQDKMKKNSSNPSEITRIDVWIKAHTKKNGESSSSKVVEVKSEASNDGQNQNLSTSTQSNSTPQHVSPNRKGQKCKLLNWLEVDEVVAIGRWVTNDPNAMVHCVALGKNASRVWVDEVKNPSVELWKKYADMETIEDALGSSIAWPTEAIIVMED
ncbi:hypothetical protein WN943_011426 [Citrus x changshan-huyou]